MASFVFNSPYLALAGTDRSSYVASVTLTVDAAELDATNATSAGWQVPIAGRKSGSLAITFNDDVAANAIDSVMWSALASTITFELRADSGSVGASNPKYTGSVLVNSWGLGGSVGDLAQVSVTLPLSGPVTRATA